MKASVLVLAGVGVFVLGVVAGKMTGGGAADVGRGGTGVPVEGAGGDGGGVRWPGAGGGSGGGDSGAGGGDGGKRRSTRGGAVTVDLLMDLSNPLDWVESSVQMRDLLSVCSAADLQRLAEEVQQSPRAMQQQWMLFGLLGKRWAEIDLEGAIAFGSEGGNPMMRQTFMSAVVMELGKSDPGRAEALIDGMTGADTKMNLRNQLASVLVVTDPERAVGLVRQKGGRHGSWMMQNLFQRWVAEDLPGARAYLDKLPPGDDRQGAVQAIAVAMATEDFDGAMAWIDGLTSNQERTAAQAMIVAQLTYSDPAKGLALVESMPTGGQRSQVMSQFVQAWIQVDPEGALAWVDGLESGMERNRVLSEAGWQLAQNDPVGAVERALEMKSRHQAHSLLSGGLQNLPDEAIAGVAPKILDLPDGDMKENAVGELLSRWSRTDPLAAMRFASELPDGRNYDSGVSRAVREWAQSDGPSAAAWVVDMDEGSRREQALRGVVNGWAARDPEGAAAFVGGLGESDKPTQLIETLAAQWARRDIDTALDWSRKLDGEQRSSAIGQLVNVMSQSDPARASVMFEQEVLEGAADESRVAGIAEQLANQWGQWEPGKAVAWASGLPEKIGARAIRGAVNQWVDNDPMAVSEWLVDQPPGAMRDAAAGRLVEGIESTDPSSAFEWAGTISDDDRRFELLSQVARRWSRSDEAAAMEAVVGAPLSDEQKAKILKRFD